MNKFSKLSLLVAGFSLIVMTAARLVLGAWHVYLNVFLLFFLLSLLLTLVLDYKMYLRFLSFKTAKRGLSFGSSFLFLVIFLTSVSYLGKKYNKTFDLTVEQLHSLSEQSLTALQNLDSPLTFYVFYKGDRQNQQHRRVLMEIKNLFELYKDAHPKVKLQVLDTNKYPSKAEEYLASLPDREREDFFVFVNYKNKKVRVEVTPQTGSPFQQKALFQEENITVAIMKSQKRSSKKILFLTGHEERELMGEGPGGLKILEQSLKDSGFKVISWNLITQGIPASPPDLVMSLGPKKNFLEEEVAWLKTYLSQSGVLLLALDPKDQHNLEDFLKEYGLIYEDKYVFNVGNIILENGFSAFGMDFNPTHPITKKISQKPKSFTVFDKAGSLKELAEGSKNWEFLSLVATDKKSKSFSSLEERLKDRKKAFSQSRIDLDQLKSFTLAVSMRPKVTTVEDSKEEASKEEASKKEASKKENSKEDKKKSELIVFSDSDFLSNYQIQLGLNKDLILNTILTLTGEEEWVSIRPKQPKGTQISLNRYEQMILILIYIIFPLIFLIVGLVLWYRKRSS